MSGKKFEVGAFALQDGVVTGPADYMKERGNDRLRAIEAGTDVVFNMGMGRAPSALYASLTEMNGTPLRAIAVTTVDGTYVPFARVIRRSDDAKVAAKAAEKYGGGPGAFAVVVDTVTGEEI